MAMRAERRQVAEAGPSRARGSGDTEGGLQHASASYASLSATASAGGAGGGSVLSPASSSGGAVGGGAPRISPSSSSSLAAAAASGVVVVPWGDRFLLREDDLLQGDMKVGEGLLAPLVGGVGASTWCFGVGRVCPGITAGDWEREGG